MRIALAVGLCLIAFTAIAAPRAKGEKPQIRGAGPVAKLARELSVAA